MIPMAHMSILYYIPYEIMNPYLGIRLVASLFGGHVDEGADFVVYLLMQAYRPVFVLHTESEVDNLQIEGLLYSIFLLIRMGRRLAH